MLMRWMRAVANAVSRANTGPYAGAPRDPDLRIDDDGYSNIRYTTEHVSYTTITAATEHQCPRCGGPLTVSHRLERAAGDGDRPVNLGVVRACERCGTGAWLKQSRMRRQGTDDSA